MVSTPPLPCDFKVGDRVIFTNDYGVSFHKVVRGFTRKPQGVDILRFVYLDLDCWWFPVEPESLTKDRDETR